MQTRQNTMYNVVKLFSSPAYTFMYTENNNNINRREKKTYSHTRIQKLEILNYNIEIGKFRLTQIKFQ